MIFAWDLSYSEDKTVIVEAVSLPDGKIEVLGMKVLEELRPRPTDLVVDYEVLSS